MKKTISCYCGQLNKKLKPCSDKSSRKLDNKPSRARIEGTTRRLCELDLVVDVQVVEGLLENLCKLQILVLVVIPVALHCTTIVVLVVPDLSLATQAHD
jgi:hypothetical protein